MGRNMTKHNLDKNRISIEEWMDVLHDSLYAKKSADIAADINREISKEEGYIIWSMETDKNLCLHRGFATWSDNDFSVINEEDIEGIQQLFLFQGEISTTTKQLTTSATQLTIYEDIIGKKVHIRVVPCVVYQSEPPEFDFVNAYQFDWD